MENRKLMRNKNNMLKKLKSIFIVEDEKFISQMNPPNENVKIEDGPKAYTPIKPLPTQGNEATNPLENNKFNEILFKVMEDNNIEGFDYLEFKNSILSLSKAIPDEDTQFKSAYEVGKTMGLTKSRLIETAEFYANLLKQEETKFKQAFENQKKQQLHGREEEIKVIEKEIIEHEAKIAQLTEAIHNHKGKMDELRKAMTESSQKLAQTHSQFEFAYKNIYNKIAFDIDKINKIIS